MSHFIAAPAVISALYLFCFHFQTALSGPLDAPIIKGEIEQKGWLSILSTIELRLRNLDELYSTQLSPTLETRMQNFQNRISGMEIKLLRVEALLTTKLDRMSDNISSRHFRDDMVQTDLFRKMEAAYDGIIHRLIYMDRKSENGFSKLQDKEDVTQKRIEHLNDNIITKQDTMENRLIKLDESVEDMKELFHGSENKVHISIGKGLNSSQDLESEIKSSAKKYKYFTYSDGSPSSCENTTKSLDSLKKKISLQISLGNNTEKSIYRLSNDLEKMFNDYAVKVSDLGAQVTNSDKEIASRLKSIESLGNSTRIDIQNGLRTLMIQVGKLFKGNFNHEISDQQQLSEKLDSNFGKIIATQNQFLESCHRLQMDESQLESQISDVLNKLIDNLSKTMKEQHHSQKKIENLIMKHDLYLKKELYQTFTNIQALFQQNEKNLKLLSENLKQTSDMLQIVNQKELLADCNGTISEDVLSLEKILNSTIKEQIQSLTNSLKSAENYNNCTNTETLSKAVEILGNDIKNKTSKIDDTIKKIYHIVEEEKNILETLMITRKNISLNEENENGPDTENPSIENATKESFTDLDYLIREVFSIPNGTSTEIDISQDGNGNTMRNPKKTNLDFDIDVRFQHEENLLSNNTNYNKGNATEVKEILYNPLENKTETVNSSEEKIHNHENNNTIIIPRLNATKMEQNNYTETENSETVENFTEDELA